MKTFNRFIGHLKTVNKHRSTVRKLCFKFGLYRQGLTHDLSKFSPVEFINGVKFFTGKESPHIGERKAYGYSKAWLNHKSRNKHHAEYWNDISLETGSHRPIDMPKKYLVEMFCDRVAASMIYEKEKYTDESPLRYFLSHRDENQFSENTAKDLELLLTTLAYNGLDYTVDYIRNDFLK